MNLRYLPCLIILGASLACHAASVRLLSGESYSGTLDIKPDGLTLSSTSGAPVKVDLNNLMRATFDTQPQTQPGASPSGLLLVNGSFLTGRIKEVQPASIVLSAQTDITVPDAAIAQVNFLQIDNKNLRPPVGGGTGAIAISGDFLAGTVDGIKEYGRLQVTSEVLGPVLLSPGAQASGWVLRDVRNTPANFEVDTRDGSRYLVNDLKLTPDGVSITDPIAGAVTVKTGDLVSISASSLRFQALTAASPARIDPPPGGNPSAAYKLIPADPAAADSVPSVATAANAMVTYVLPPGFTVFSASIAVSKDSPATAHLAFDLYADGRLIFSSPTVAAGSAPQPMRVNLGPAKMITLRAEPAGPGANGAVGQWIGPILLRQ